MIKSLNVSIKTTLKASKKGSIKSFGIVTAETGTLIKSSNGEIVFEGNNYINRNCTIVAHEKIYIKKNVTIGPNVCIFDHDHNFRKTKDNNNSFISRPIEIQKNVWIGANVVILKGVTIGENSIVAAGTVVTKDIPCNVVVKNSNNLNIYEI
ncbi:DapH/DapD/GlmU-related protein [Exiguobacterium sp. UBA4551]|uniref:DapH/DapD/GlmU-related protein n=1 Tax=Exiguobacterium sp. UBA4551 TaxID=1946494 RepID=UPI00257F5975|nr:DapH/DapD/GlmU-related protein [Exiguobacterium sp. UBA4551]